MEEAGVTRRGLLLGTTGVVAGIAGGGFLVEQDVLPGRSRAYALLGLNGEGAPVPDVEAGPRVDGTLDSRAMGIEVGWTVAYPPGHGTDAALPLLVALHAAAGNHETVFDAGLALDRFLALAVGAGAPPFAVVAADGTPRWPLEPGGGGSGGMVVTELLPAMAERGLDVGRMGYLGWSAGGYAALALGASGGDEVRVVVATSPALSGSEPEELLEQWREAYAETPLRIDIGRGDPFYHPVTDLVDSLDPSPAGEVTPGGHTHPYWRSVAQEQLEYVGAQLAGE